MDVRERKLTIEEMNLIYTQIILELYDMNREKTRKHLGISLKTLNKYIKNGRYIREKVTEVIKEVKKIEMITDKEPEQIAIEYFGFPTNKERIRYADEMINRNRL